MSNQADGGARRQQKRSASTRDALTTAHDGSLT
jgi:hypothetical protein